MAYTVRYTDEANKGIIIVEDNTINDTDTSLSIPGRNTTSYGAIVAENFLHLLENFANSGAPSNPTEGQLWYDTSPGENKQLKIYDGTNWVAAGNVKKGATEPAVSQSIIGDLWSDTNNQQLYLFTGSAWTLVGPKFSDGLETGAEAEVITGTDDVEYVCLVARVNSEPVMIISNSEFTPKSTIPGFTANTIRPGVNLSTRDVTGAGAPKFLGTSEKAENLIVGGDTVPGSNFLRGDAISTSNFPLRIKENGGITVGAGSQLKVGVEGDKGIIEHVVNGSSVNVRVNNSGTTQTALTVLSNTNVGINKENPIVSLDVNGDSKISGLFEVSNTTQSISIGTGSGVFKGGVGIAKDLFVGGDAAYEGTITTQNINPSLNDTYNIGSPGSKFDSIYATTFVGNLTGTVSGSIDGRAGSADKLTSTTTFNIIGDVGLRDPGSLIEFDGQVGGTTKVFDLVVREDFIRTKGVETLLKNTDEILVSRSTTDQNTTTTGLKRITVNNLFRSIPKTPVGAIMMYSLINTAGEIVDDSGGIWLVCDGREIRQTDYPELFSQIGFTFKDQSLIEGASGSDQGQFYFALPDMRGRFPLGVTAMQVSAASGLAQVDNPTGDSRVTDSRASSLGNPGGLEKDQINLENLPEHKHDMLDSNSQKYYAINDSRRQPGDSDIFDFPSSSGSKTFSALPNSGGVLIDDKNDLGEDFNFTNPFMALNFIIYAGGSN